MTYEIRSGQQSDVVTCVDILCTWINETPWLFDPRTPDEQVLIWREFFRHDLAWVAESGDRIIGFCSRGDDNINALYVATDWRSRGIGKGLLDMAKAVPTKPNVLMLSAINLICFFEWVRAFFLQGLSSFN